MKDGDLDDKVFCSVTEYNEFGHKVGEFSGQNKDIDTIMRNITFTGGEFCPEFKVPIKDKTVYISATSSYDVGPQELHMRVCLAADAAKQNGAKEVVLIQPMLSYSRQDRGPKDDEKLKGQPYSSLVLARNFYMNGVDRILTMHLHSRDNYYPFAELYFKDELDKYIGQFEDTEPKEVKEKIDDKKVELGRRVVYNLNPNPIFAHYLRFSSSIARKNQKNKGWQGEDVVFISPDLGARYHILDLRNLTFLKNSSYCNCLKVRGEPNNPHDMTVELDTFSENFFDNGGLENKIIVIGDDMIDTGGTIEKTCIALKNGHDYGRPKAIILAFSHAVLAGKAYRNIQQKIGAIKPQEIITLNTLPYIETRRNPGWKKYSSVLRIAHYISDAIKNCIEPEVNPTDFYNYDSLEQLKDVSKLYDNKSSTMHFLNR